MNEEELLPRLKWAGNKWIGINEHIMTSLKGSGLSLHFSLPLREYFSPESPVPPRSSSSPTPHPPQRGQRVKREMDGPLSKLQNRETTHDFVKSNQVIVMEHQVAVEHKNIVRAKLKECILQNFENANENCYELRLQYANMVKDRFGAMLFPTGSEPTNRVHRHLVEKK